MTIQMKDKYTFEELVEIIKVLRGEGGCPWDRVQTHDSLKKSLLEETYEAIEVIDKKDNEKMCEELGDVLLQVVFHGQIAKDEGAFDINDIITGVCQKMIYRHTHVFGEDTAETPEDVLVNWEKQKRKEKSIESHTEAVKSVSSALPALMRSYKVQDKAAKAGFDFPDIYEALLKVDEELYEFREACEEESTDHIEEELGDLLFSIVNVSRFVKVQPELALGRTIEKFIQRFSFVEEEAAKNGRKLDEMTLEEMDELWNKAKNV